MVQHSSDGFLRLVVIVVALVVLLPLLVMGLLVPFMWGMGGWGGGMMGDWSGGMMGGWGAFGGVMLLVWILALAGAGYLAARWFQGSSAGQTDPALEDLRLQYARGELTDEEFEERRATLTQNERVD